jgi:phosphoribosyl-AMP cyclohydrolase
MEITSFLKEIKFTHDGLVPVIAQDDKGQVLMMAWMNKEALQETLRTNTMCYYSRSRNKLWYKGETSGQTQELLELMLDCDGDTLLATVKQNGVACHTGHKSCFFRTFKNGTLIENQDVITDPKALYNNADT